MEILYDSLTKLSMSGKITMNPNIKEQLRAEATRANALSRKVCTNNGTNKRRQRIKE